MALKFNCKDCGEPMIVKFLTRGQVAECRNCGGDGRRTEVRQTQERFPANRRQAYSN